MLIIHHKKLYRQMMNLSVNHCIFIQQRCTAYDLYFINPRDDCVANTIDKQQDERVGELEEAGPARVSYSLLQPTCHASREFSYFNLNVSQTNQGRNRNNYPMTSRDGITGDVQA